MGMTDDVKKAAEEYAFKQNIGVPGAVVHSMVCNAYNAGDAHGFARAVKMLRSEKAYSFRETHAKRLKQCWMNTEMADWLEEREKEE